MKKNNKKMAKITNKNFGLKENKKTTINQLKKIGKKDPMFGCKAVRINGGKIKRKEIRIFFKERISDWFLEKIIAQRKRSENFKGSKGSKLKTKK
jgi:hypothetical protein